MPNPMTITEPSSTSVVKNSRFDISNMTLTVTGEEGDAVLSAVHAVGANSQIAIHAPTSIKNLTATGHGDQTELYGLTALEGTITADQNVTIDGLRSETADAWVAALEAVSGTIDLKKGAVITHLSGDHVFAVEAFGGGRVDINSSLSLERVILENDITATDSGTVVNVNFMTADSVFSGLTPEDPDRDHGTINLRFDNGATWNVSEDNTLHGTLTLHEGVVVLGDAASSRIATRAASAPVTLTIDNIAKASRPGWAASSAGSSSTKKAEASVRRRCTPVGRGNSRATTASRSTVWNSRIG